MQSKNYPITQWAIDDQPREKLLRKSPMALSDSELLAILINKGTPKMSAVDLGREIMKMGQNNLNDLFKLTVSELKTLPGIGTAKAVTVVAALELGRRRHASEPQKKITLSNSQESANYLRALLRDQPAEVFGAIYLNQASKVNHFDMISHGGITGTIADPRMIIKKALEEDAVNIILCHNHPSGNLQPSAADRQLTRKIKEAAALFDIRLLDHIIVSEEGYFSFADENIL